MMITGLGLGGGGFKNIHWVVLGFGVETFLPLDIFRRRQRREIAVFNTAHPTDGCKKQSLGNRVFH